MEVLSLEWNKAGEVKNEDDEEENGNHSKLEAIVYPFECGNFLILCLLGAFCTILTIYEALSRFKSVKIYFLMAAFWCHFGNYFFISSELR